MTGRFESDRVLRGGSYNNNAETLRCGARNRNNANNRNNNIGFRIVVAHGFCFSPEMVGGYGFRPEV
ncbi:SUMF1/EgtB/PvdO family nonheme iron enzyme [uncultured Desulfuromonas sp.]|uniref:SUMF1/EgtB/PvdO family nonheme iron enzyme n=1 Tax=uncultured Desulfuromonas sp. TaxID=181013 RepID=UPI00374C9578